MSISWLWLGIALAEPPEVATSPPVQRFDNAALHTFVGGLLGAEAAAAARKADNAWEFVLEGHPVTILTDENADRMRVMVPVVPVQNLPPGAEQRMLQANFDAVLDARYAIAQGAVWSVFIHPLSPLTNPELGSGLAQTVTAAETFGSTFTSGALVFGGGDSSELQENLYKKILDQIRLREQGI